MYLHAGSPFKRSPSIDDMPHAKDLHRELDLRETVQVGVDYHVGDVAVDEHLSGQYLLQFGQESKPS
jgi:hypothetical protein